MKTFTANVDAFAPEFLKGDVLFVSESAPIKEGDFVLVRRGGDMYIDKMSPGLQVVGRIMRRDRPCA